MTMTFERPPFRQLPGKIASDREPRRPRASVPRVAGRPWERDHVAHVGKPGRVGHRALEPETEAGVRHGPVTAKIAVPPVVLRVEAGRLQARIEHVEPLFALA